MNDRMKGSAFLFNKKIDFYYYLFLRSSVPFIARTQILYLIT